MKPDPPNNYNCILNIIIIMITIMLARFPLSSEALGLRVVLYEYLGGDVSLGP